MNLSELVNITLVSADLFLSMLGQMRSRERRLGWRPEQFYSDQADWEDMDIMLDNFWKWFHSQMQKRALTNVFYWTRAPSAVYLCNWWRWSWTFKSELRNFANQQVWHLPKRTWQLTFFTEDLNNLTADTILQTVKGHWKGDFSQITPEPFGFDR